jgi:hypothetical protein
LRIDTARDVVPGGLAMAMAPVLVNWRESPLGFGPDGHYSVRNVNLFGDPVSGITLLGGVRMPAASIKRVEFVLVMSKLGSLEANIAGHAMLRFVFKDDCRPHVLGDSAMAATHDWSLHDLILSWEAWRPPNAGFDPIAGLDPKKYALTLRAYAGSCRCLADTILDRPWRCYPLRLPDVPHFAEELLYVSLLLGDAVARHTIGGLLQHRITKQSDAPADYEELDELALGHRRTALVRVPAALRWLTGHQTVVPGKSVQLLDEVGLLERDKGRIAMRHYDNRTESPYGKLKDNLIY